MDTKARHIAHTTSMELSIQREARELTKEEALVHNQALVVLQIFLKIAEKEARKELEREDGP